MSAFANKLEAWYASSSISWVGPWPIRLSHHHRHSCRFLHGYTLVTVNRDIIREIISLLTLTSFHHRHRRLKLISHTSWGWIHESHVSFPPDLRRYLPAELHNFRAFLTLPWSHLFLMDNFSYSANPCKITVASKITSILIWSTRKIRGVDPGHRHTNSKLGKAQEQMTSIHSAVQSSLFLFFFSFFITSEKIVSDDCAWILLCSICYQEPQLTSCEPFDVYTKPFAFW